MAICYYCFHLDVFHVDMEDRIHKIIIYDMPHACLLFLRIRHSCAVSLRPSMIRDVLKSQFSNKKYRHSQTDAAVTFRKLRRKSNFAPIWTECTYGHLIEILFVLLYCFDLICLYNWSSSNLNSSTLETVRPQHDCPAACVVAQQYSSATLLSLRCHYRKKKFGAIFKTATLSIF
jgi:hypothetical protein